MEPLTSAETQDPAFPSSFLRDPKENEIRDSTNCCTKSNYMIRRHRKFWVFFLVTFFVVAGVVASIQLGLFHGHIVVVEGGAGSYLDSDAAQATGGIKGSPAQTTQTDPSKRTLTITTWNIAAINNNPFEYWLTVHDNPEYEALMNNVEKFIEYPADHDIAVDQVFTEEMFAKLDEQLTKVGWESVKSYWDNDFKKRKIVSEFLKDPLLGSKRLASMPDRVTNTINVAGSSIPVCRPTVINMYEGDLGTMEKWWNAWEAFMFVNKLSIPQGDGSNVDQIPYQMLQPIKKAKYPDITEEEEKVSLPLQTLCGAIFDGILVHMMNTVSKPDVWQPLKKKIVESLNKQKVPKTLEILEQEYASSDIINLQEVSTALINLAKASTLGKRYHIIAPADMDATRDQNSIIMLKREVFPKGDAYTEITSKVTENFPEGVKVPVANGDILAITAEDKNDVEYVLASFHGDTNGLATIPVLDAIKKTMITSSMNARKLIFGLDANTYEKGSAKKQDVTEFGEHYRKFKLTSAWGDVPNPSNYTTYNARTYLQPQLNKACKSSEKRECGDVNPKDFILFSKEDFTVVSTIKDNTGKMKYIEDMAFPTLDFPSDHGILSTTISYNK